MSQEDINFFRKHLKTSGGVETFIKHLMQVGQQNVHTPFDLCQEIISKLQEFASLADKKIAVLFNTEFLHVLIDTFGVNLDNITMFADDPVEFEFCKLQYKMKPGINLFQIDIPKTIEEEGLRTREGNCVMKFDVLVMNPPYQAPCDKEVFEEKTQKQQKGSRASLWDKFVKLSFDIVKDNGFVCAVHPSLWRRTDHKLFDTIVGNNLFYLSIHDVKSGVITFGASTRFDWYVAQKAKYSGNTIIVDEKGMKNECNISEFRFIPNCNFDLIKKIIAQKDQKVCDIAYSYSAYDHRKPWVSQLQSEKFKYPLVYSITKGRGLELYYTSDNSKDELFVPKVIFNIGGTFLDAIVDVEGKYGMCEFACGIKIATKQEGENIKKAILSEEFKKIWIATQWQAVNRDCRMFRYFRKDFWKDFV